MIQFVKFATMDPVGFTIVKLDDIKAIQTTLESDVCTLTTPHDQLLVKGSFDHFIDLFRSLVGGEWDAIPEPQPIESND